MTDSHIEKQLTQMMLDRAAREIAAGNLDGATALMRSVILGYPDHPSCDSDRHRGIEAVLRNEPHPPDRYEIAATLFDLAELRLANFHLEDMGEHTRKDVADTIDGAILKAVIPRLAFVADAIVERHNDGTLFETRRGGSALTFGGSTPSKALVDLIRACFAVTEWLKAHPALPLLALLAGDSAVDHTEDLLPRITRAENADPVLAGALDNLATQLKEESGHSGVDAKQKLIEALLAIPAEVRTRTDNSQ